MTRRLCATAVLVCAAVLSGRALLAQAPNEVLPSYREGQLAESAGIENLSLAAGDVQISAPVGPEYTIGPGTTWRLSANYSTRLWTYYSDYCGNPDPLCGTPGLIQHAVLAGTSALGVGWSINPAGFITGDISNSPEETPAPRYVDPGGSVHKLLQGPAGYFLADDGFFARFYKVTSPFEQWRMELPDGNRWHFASEFVPPAKANGWDFLAGQYAFGQAGHHGLTRIEDRFGNEVLTVTYRSAPAEPWQVEKITLSGGREILFTWGTFQTAAYASEPARTWQVLENVSFPILGGNRLTASFTRQDGTMQRPSFEQRAQGCPFPLAPYDFRVPHLTGITASDQSYAFEYTSAAAPTSGVLTAYRLATGGRVSFEYNDFGLLTEPCARGSAGCPSVLDYDPPTFLSRGAAKTSADPSCAPFSKFIAYLDSAPVVSKRTETDPVTGVTSVSTYRRSNLYEPVGDPNNGEPDFERVLRVLVVDRPDGNGGTNATKHFFAVGTKGGQTGTELARRYYSGTDVRGAPTRTMIFCHDASSFTPTVCGPLQADGKIGRVSTVPYRMQRREVTWYGDHLAAGQPTTDGGYCSAPTSVTVACWQRSNDNYVPDAQEFATETTLIPSSGPSLAFLGNGQLWRQTATNWTPNAATQRWLPKLFSSRTTEDFYSGAGCPVQPCSVTTNYGFNLTSGALESTSVSDPTDGLSRTETFAYTNGDPTSQTIFGTGLANTYTTTRTFSGGLVTSSQRTAPAGISWKGFDVTRDPSLGLITASRDPNPALQTTYGYDLLGRLTDIQPPAGEAGSKICYTPWSAATPSRGAYVLVKKGGSLDCGTGAPTPSEGSGTAEAFLYDGLGRVHRQIRLQPSTTATGTYLAVRRTERNAAGLVSAVSEWDACGSGSDLSTCFYSSPFKKTAFSSFDFLSRARSIVQPDGTSITKTFDDFGIPSSDFREDTTIANVAGGSTFDVTRKDLFGRLIVVAEPKMTSDPAAFGPFNFYHYNVLDKLVKVDPSRDFGGVGVSQPRTFAYDALGLLKSETHPEKGTTSYSSFTALGDPQVRSEGGITTTSTFDSLGRLTLLQSGGATYLQTWYDGNEGGAVGYPNGKLTKRVGYNPGAFENAQVEDIFTYGAPAGRLSKRATNVRRGTFGNPVVHTTEQTFTWNALGLLAAHGLPGPAGKPSALVETFYSAGSPTRVTSGGVNVATSVTYHPHGGLKSYTTANGVVTTLASDPNLMPRTSRVSTTGASLNFDSGAFSYDGAGNVTEMRLSPSLADVFTYDRLSRIKSTTFGTLSPAATETFAYDGDAEKGFGNLIQRVFNGGAVSLDASSSTNRLLSASYDARGNQTAYGLEGFEYDALSRRVRYRFNGAEKETFLYGGDAERIAKVVPTSTLPAAEPGPLRFFTLNPCRLLDTRNPTGTFGGPSLQGQASRTFPAAGNCGIPTSAASLALNVTTVPKAGSTFTTAELTAYRSDALTPPVASASVVNPSKTRATFAIIGLSSTGGLKLYPTSPANEQVDAIVDVSGYFAPPQAPPTAGSSWLLTYRDPANRPVAEYRFDDQRPGLVLPQKVNVYLGNTLVATREDAFNPAYSGRWTYFSSDHLGTPRLKTGLKAQGQSVAPTLESYRYRAFGAKFPQLVQADREGREFALMERDTASGNHLDHARYFSDWPARFLSPDLLQGTPEDPQSWNRYTYALNNPLRFVDPDGRNPVPQRVAMMVERAWNSPAATQARQWFAAQGSRAWNFATRLFNSQGGQDAVRTATEITTGAQLGPAAGFANFTAQNIGRQIGKEIVESGLEGGRLGLIASKITSLRFSSRSAATATEAAVQELGLETAGIVNAGENLIVTSVRTGKNQPVMIVRPDGSVGRGTATLEIKDGLMAVFDVLDGGI